jgi:hypothetical protein
MTVKEFIEWLKLHDTSNQFYIAVEDYGITEGDFMIIATNDRKTILSIAKPTKKNYKERAWVKE